MNLLKDQFIKLYSKTHIYIYFFKFSGYMLLLQTRVVLQYFPKNNNLNPLRNDTSLGITLTKS